MSDEGGGEREERNATTTPGRAWARSGLPALAVAAVALASLVGGCASAGPGQEGEAAGAEPEITIRVVNNLTPAITVNVLAAPVTRPLDFLGTVHSNSTASFALRTRLIPGRFRLVAERTNGTVQVSREIQIVSDGSVVEWNLELDVVRIEARDGG